MPALRIAHIGPSTLPIGYVYGGAVERRMVELAAAQMEQGHDVLVVSLAPPRSEPRVPDSARGFRLHDVACRTRRPWRDLELLARARAVLHRFAPDVVHVHNSPAGAVLLTGIPAVKVLSFDYLRYRGTERPAVKAVYRRALKAFDLLLPVSEFCAREAAAWWSLPPADFRVLPNGVNVTQFSPDAPRRSAARRRYGLDGAVVIGYVGRVCEQKGSDMLIEAFRRVRRGFPRAALVVAGPSGRFGSTVSTPLTDEVHDAGGRWLGPVPEDELADVFRCLDICAMPTREDEMFGMAAAEALAAGTPVVCSDLGGLPEVVAPGAGMLVPPGDSRALADALLVLCEDPAGRSRLADAAPGAVSKFSWPAIADQAERLYHEVRRQ